MRTGVMNRRVVSADQLTIDANVGVFVLDQRETTEASPECLPSNHEHYLFVIPIGEDWGMFVPADAIDF